MQNMHFMTSSTAESVAFLGRQWTCSVVSLTVRTSLTYLCLTMNNMQ
jgi:hypothetical protein